MEYIRKDLKGQVQRATLRTTIWLPEGFDPTDCLPAGLWKLKNEARLIVQWVATRMAMSYRPNRWIPLHHEHGIRLSGNKARWDKLKPALIKCGALECDGEWRRGKKSLWYRLQQPWCDSKLVPHTIGDELADRLRYSDDAMSGRDGWEPVHHHLEDSLSRLNVDESAARKWTNRLSSPRQRHAQMMVNLVQAGNPRMSLSRFGRVFSVVTQTPSRIRKCIRVGDQALVEQDISACQPLLLGLHCMHSFSACIDQGRERTGSSFYMMSDSAPISTHASIPADLKDYIRACENGDFYEELATVLKMRCSNQAERNAVKREWCRIAYGKPNPGPKWDACILRWPTVAWALTEIKSTDHKNAARLLQKAESQIMIAGVADQMREQHADAPVVTVHDSVLTTEAMAGEIRDIILQNWGHYGGKPKIKSA